MDDALALDPEAVLWSAPLDDEAARSPLLVMLHGYGADEHDLFGLTPGMPSGFVVAAVRAPLSVPWPGSGYSWYPVDDITDQQLVSGDPTRVTDAASAFLDWLDECAGPHRTVGMLGFSQGASIALQTLRLRPTRFAFAVVLSGYAVPGSLPLDAQLAEHPVPVFWGRGGLDTVIPTLLVEHTTQWLPGHADLSGRVYPQLGHGVSDDEARDVRAFLDKRLAALAA